MLLKMMKRISIKEGEMKMVMMMMIYDDYDDDDYKYL